MKKLLSSLFTCVALVACAPGPDGADGAAGVQGAQGAQGVQGEPGAPGADAPAREGTIVSVTTGPVVAGGSVEMHVMGQYTEWTEAPTITTEYEGLSVSTVVTSPVSLIVTITAAEDVRGGEADLIMGDLQLPKTVEVIPAARFVLDEGQEQPLRPGQSFTGTIVFAEGFGAIGSTGVRFNAADEDPVKVVLTEQLAFEGSSDLGVSGITVEGFVSPSAAAGASDWRVVTMDQTQTIPVFDAIQVADQPAVDLALGGTLDASLETGFGLFRLVRGEGGVIPAGTVVRVEALNADFPVTMVASLPASGDDPPAAWSNTDAIADVTTNTIEFIAPRTAAYFLSIDHEEGSEGAEFTFTASATEVQMQVANGEPTEVTLERPGHGAWFARQITAGQSLTWAIEPGEESDYSPAFYCFRNYTDEDGNDIFGGALRITASPLMTGWAVNFYGRRGISWPEQWGESLFIWRVVDAQLGGGGGYTLSFTGNVE